MIGPNGAGKTTLFSTLVGLIRPDTGSVMLDGKNLGGLKPHRVAGLGMTKTFQNVALFAESSGARQRAHCGPSSSRRGGRA